MKLKELLIALFFILTLTMPIHSYAESYRWDNRLWASIGLGIEGIQVDDYWGLREGIGIYGESALGFNFTRHVAFMLHTESRTTSLGFNWYVAGMGILIRPSRDSPWFIQGIIGTSDTTLYSSAGIGVEYGHYSLNVRAQVADHDYFGNRKAILVGLNLHITERLLDDIGDWLDSY